MRDTAAKLIAKKRLDKEIHDELPIFQRPSTLAEGYEIQSEVHQLLIPKRGPVVGFKIGCTTKVMQDFLNINIPCAGGFFLSEKYDDGSYLSLADYTNLGLECELVIELSKDLKTTKSQLEPSDLIECVKSVGVAIELVENRYKNYHDFGVPSLIADDFFTAGMVLGPTKEKWDISDINDLSGIIRINGSKIEQTPASNETDNPLAALCWLANLKNQQRQPLLENNYILTGSVTETKWISSPGIVNCEIRGLGSVSVEFF